ncbi:hypothetical protein AD935_07975 [Gluconobacter japonicus]|nr:hypothetical protein AD935_07975 [Gluconobacter japonicus]
MRWDVQEKLYIQKLPTKNFLENVGVGLDENSHLLHHACIVQKHNLSIYLVHHILKNDANY